MNRLYRLLEKLLDQYGKLTVVEEIVDRNLHQRDLKEMPDDYNKLVSNVQRHAIEMQHLIYDFKLKYDTVLKFYNQLKNKQ